MSFLSIVIPCYNSQETILPLFASIASSRKVRWEEVEVIVVDDKSEDETVETVKNYVSDSDALKQGPTLFRIVRLRKNQGPAWARNVGVKHAKGKVVLFLDSDVVVYRNTLYEVIRSFKEDPDLHALTGVWDKRQKSERFFPKFKALRDWSYWINERDPRNYYYLFSTRVAAIERELFLRLGGFNETYKAALVEDIEFTYRIARRYAVVFNPKVIVSHEFEDFWPVAKKYFWRSFYWSRIYRERKKFDPVATTGKEALTTISAGGLVMSLLVWGIIRGIGETGVIGGVMKGIGMEELEKLFFVLCSLFFVVHLWGVRKFLWFCTREKGLFFAIKAFFTGVALYLVILAGATASLVKR